jgi:hypothetical protein
MQHSQIRPPKSENLLKHDEARSARAPILLLSAEITKVNPAFDCTPTF